MDDWDYLQLQCAMYINGANVPSVRAEWQQEKKPIRAFSNLQTRTISEKHTRNISHCCGS